MTALELYRPDQWWPQGEPVRTGEVLAYASGAKIRPAYGRSDTAGYLPFVAETFGLRVVVTGAWTLAAEVAS